jgi:hypothetical protein
MRRHMQRNRRAAAASNVKHARARGEEAEEALDAGLIDPGRSAAVGIP